MSPQGKSGRPVLLTGGTGQVGSELVRMLSGYEVVAPKRSELNLSNAESVRACIRAVKPGVIVNAGAYTAVDKAESERIECFAANAEGPRALAEAGLQVAAPILHFSTDYVFDGAKPGAYLENDPVAPLSVYGQSKEQGERNIRATTGAAIILRCSWIYSTHGTNFLRTILRLRNERDTLRIVDDQIGAPTWARGIAEAAATIIRSATQSGNGFQEFFVARSGTYHLSAGGSTTWKGFAQAILGATPGKQPAVEGISTSEYGAAAPRPRNSVLDNSKIAGAFGVRLPAWQDQLKACLANQ